MKDQRKAYAFGLITVLLWSTVATAFKLSLRHVEPVQLLLWANVTSIVVLVALLAARQKLRLVVSYSRGQYLRSLGLGLLNPFLYYLVLFEAYDRLPAQEAQPLNYTWAITLSLLSIPLLKQKISGRDLGAVAVSYAGVLVISTRGDVLSLRFTDALGVGLALGSTVIWALYWIYNTRDERDPVAALLLSFVFGLPFVFAACMVLSTPWVTSGWGLAGAAYVGVFEMGLTFVLWLSALRYAQNAARVSQLIFLSPFLSLVFIHFLLGEPILPSTYVGLVLIVVGLLLRKRMVAQAARPRQGSPSCPRTFPSRPA